MFSKINIFSLRETSVTQDVKATYITSPEAGRLLGITQVGVAQLVRQGKIPAVKIANRWLIPRAFVEEYAKTYEGKRGRPRSKGRPVPPSLPEATSDQPIEPATVDLDIVPETAEVKAEPEEDFAGNVRVDYLDENYDFEVYEKGKITENARLIVARLKPRIAVLPQFTFRWDYRYDHLNVDIHGVGLSERDWFREGHHGYSGHLPRRLGDPEHTFEVSIWMPGTHVFRGRMSFALRKYAESVEETHSTAGLADRFKKWRWAIGRKRTD